MPASPQGEDAFRLKKPNCVFSAPARAIPRGRQLRRTNDMGKHIADAQRHTIEGILKHTFLTFLSVLAGIFTLPKSPLLTRAAYGTGIVG